jgi:hypothetical protein
MHGNQEKLCPCFCQSFTDGFGDLHIICASGMEEFMDKNTSGFFLAIDNNSIRTAGVGISAVEISGSGSGSILWKPTGGGIGEPEDTPASLARGSKRLEHLSPFL